MQAHRRPTWKNYSHIFNFEIGVGQIGDQANWLKIKNKDKNFGLIKRGKSALDSCLSKWQLNIMSRPLRIQYPVAWDHVMFRGRRVEVIFGGNKAYFALIDLLRDTVDLCHVRVSTCCLPGHHPTWSRSLIPVCPGACGTLAAFLLGVSTGPITWTVNAFEADMKPFW
jgi:hypothetical protein